MDGALSDTPLIIIKAPEGGPDDWLERQAALRALSTRSEQRIAEGGSHLLHLERPDIIFEVVDDLIDTLR